MNEIATLNKLVKTSNVLVIEFELLLGLELWSYYIKQAHTLSLGNGGTGWLAFLGVVASFYLMLSILLTDMTSLRFAFASM